MTLLWSLSPLAVFQQLVNIFVSFPKRIFPFIVVRFLCGDVVLEGDGVREGWFGMEGNIYTYSGVGGWEGRISISRIINIRSNVKSPCYNLTTHLFGDHVLHLSVVVNPKRLFKLNDLLPFRAQLNDLLPFYSDLFWVLGIR